MSEDDPFMIEEAHYKARLFLDKMAADSDRTDDLKNPAFVMFLEIERGGAKRTRVSSPPVSWTITAPRSKAGSPRQSRH